MVPKFTNSCASWPTWVHRACIPWDTVVREVMRDPVTLIEKSWERGGNRLWNGVASPGRAQDWAGIYYTLWTLKMPFGKDSVCGGWAEFEKEILNGSQWCVLMKRPPGHQAGIITICVSNSQSLNISGPQFLHVKSGNSFKVYPLRVSGEFYEIVHIKPSAQGLANNKQ